jgi:hypothetical protein
MAPQMSKLINPKHREEDGKKQLEALFTEMDDRFGTFSDSTISEHFAK